MILTDEHPQWVFIEPSRGVRHRYATPADYWAHNGKFVITGNKPYIDRLVPQIDGLVEKAYLDSAKFTKKDPTTDPLPHVPEYALLVYADDREMEDVAWLLFSLGVNKLAWKYDWESIEDWSPEGALAKKAAEVGRSVDPWKY